MAGIKNSDILRKIVSVDILPRDFDLTVVSGATLTTAGGAVLGTAGGCTALEWSAFDSTQTAYCQLNLDNVDLSNPIFFRADVGGNGAGTLTPTITIGLLDPGATGYIAVPPASFGTTYLQGGTGTFPAVTIGASFNAYSTWTNGNRDAVYIPGGALMQTFQNHSSARLIIKFTFSAKTGARLTAGYLINLKACYTPLISTKTGGPDYTVSHNQQFPGQP